MPARRKKSGNINLLPKEDFDKTTLGRILSWALTTFRIIVIAVEFVVISGFLSRFYLDVRIGDLEEEIKQQSALIDSQHDFEKEFRTVQSRLTTISSINSDPGNKLVPVVDIISKEIPQDARLISINKTGNLVTIRGAAFSESSINLFLGTLKKQGSFSQVSVVRLEREADSPYNIFTIEAQINNTAQEPQV